MRVAPCSTLHAFLCVAAWLRLGSAVRMAEVSMPDPICRLIAGGIASGTAKTAMAPFERVKLILQTSHKYANALEALRRIPAEEGVASLWRGNVANLARIVPTYAMRFALLDNFRAAVRLGAPAGTRLTLAQELCAGALAGAAVCVVTHPLDLARTHLAVASGAHASAGVRGTLGLFVRKYGVVGLYRGLAVSLLEIMPYTAISLGGFEYIKASLSASHVDPRSKLAASWLSGLCASLLCYPLDSVKRRLMVDGVTGGGMYGGSIARCITTVIRLEGARGLYRGCLLNALKSAPTFAATATMNDLLKVWLGCGVAAHSAKAR
ncbi:hypothetical protein KFE25_005880 [Diacronema lutheri]|uniref:ADP,ATP carrier protein n=1 Tax=Diacronema lutheri TaxID=2081491 RepID=A0A8J5XWV1_DIALT|nr:hypothetical protein KFE25_005880 [Diacronema lutheri]